MRSGFSPPCFPFHHKTISSFLLQNSRLEEASGLVEEAHSHFVEPRAWRRLSFIYICDEIKNTFFCACKLINYLGFLFGRSSGMGLLHYVVFLLVFVSWFRLKKWAAREDGTLSKFIRPTLMRLCHALSNGDSHLQLR